MPRKMRRAALRSALSVKAGNGDIVLLDEISMDAPKTKEMVASHESTWLRVRVRCCYWLSAIENVELSARNLADVKALRATYLNIRDLLGYDKLVMPLAALDVLTNSFLGSEE
jgi:large subunit ribosomal protein L4